MNLRNQCTTPLHNYIYVYIHTIGNGTDLPVAVIVNNRNALSSEQYSFKGSCNLKCPQQLFPDVTCHQCLGKPSDADGDGSSTQLNNLVSVVMTNLVQGTYTSDVNFIAVAQLYQNNPLEALTIPRYNIPSAEMDLKFAITAVDNTVKLQPITSRYLLCTV